MKVFKYCPNCKFKLNKTEESYFCKSCQEKFYLNPAPTASVLPIKYGRVLLAKRGIEPYKGEYDLIGGFIKPGESAENAATRETKEETGLNVRIIQLIGTYPDQYGKGGNYTINIHFIAEVIGGKPEPQSDASSLEWIPIKEIPKLKLKGFKNTREALKDLQKWYKERK